MTAISWKNGLTDYWSDTAAWSTGAVPGANDDVTISVAPSTSNGLYSVILQDAKYSAHSVTLDQQAATLDVVSSTLSVGTTFSFLAGSIELSNSTLQGGTYSNTNGTVICDGNPNFINSVTWDGALTLSGGGLVELNSFTLQGANGTGTGTLAINDVQAVVSTGTPTTFSNALIRLDNGTLLVEQGGLTIARNSSLSDTGAGTITSDVSGTVFSNEGTISATGTAGTLVISPGTTVSNTGTLLASNGGSLIIGRLASGTNSGLISIAPGSFGEFETPLTNTGTVSVAGTLLLGYALTTAEILPFAISSGTLALGGTLSNSGATLSTGANLANLMLEGGTINGGTVVNNGHFSFGAIASNNSGVPSAGTLTSVIFDGPLSLTTPLRLTVTGNLALNGASGSGAGSMIVTGAGAGIDFSSSQELNNANIQLGSNSPTATSYLLASGSGTTTALVLGPKLSITQSGIEAEIYANDGEIENQGTITAAVSGGTLQLGSFTNAGTIDDTNEIVSANTSAGATLTNSGTLSISGKLGALYANSIGTDVVDNTGLLSVSNGATVRLGGTADNLQSFINTGTLSISASSVTLNGSYTTSSLGTVIVSNGGSLNFGPDSYLNNAGGTLSVGAGSAFGTLGLQGILSGGVISDSGSGINFGVNPALEGVTYKGLLSIRGAETVTVTGGITLLPLTGSGAGSINLTGVGAVLDFTSTEALSNVQIAIGASSGGATLSAEGSGTNTLTLATGVLMQQVGASAAIGGLSGTIDNLANLNFAKAAGTLTLAGNIVNSGTIAVSNGESLVLATSSLKNTGSIILTDGQLSIYYGTSSELEAVKFVNSNAYVTGTLNNTGSTLSVGAGAAIPEIKLQGTILGGTINDAGGGVQFFGTQAVLNGVTYEGTLSINRPLSALTVLNGLTATSLTGTAPGSLTLTGAGSALIWNSTQALDNATLTIGNAGLSYEGHSVAAPAIAGNAITLGAHLTVQQSAAYADIGGIYQQGNTTPLYTAEGSVQSAASISAAIAGGDFTLEGQTFTSTGTIAISNGDTVTAGAANTTNAGLITVGSLSALNLDLYNYFADASLADESFTNAGSITLAGGTLNELTDGGTFPEINALNAAGANIKGFGTINAALLNNGVVEANGGTLTVAQAVSGSGTLQVDAGAVLNLTSVSNGETATFYGSGGRLGLAPPSFLGVIAKFGVNDSIDLANTAASAASFSGDSIVVTLSAGGTITLATTSALAGSLTITAGTHGDSILHYSSAAVRGQNPLVTTSIGEPALSTHVNMPEVSWLPVLHS